MPSGTVGGGSQNSYESQGTIFQKNPVPERTSPQPILFRKSNRTPTTKRNESECWNAGTPITWGESKLVDGVIAVTPDHQDYPKVTEVLCTDEDGYEISILATLDDNGNPKEFHPLIQLYNEILARLFTDPKVDGRAMLDGLKSKKSALKLWRYLEGKYLGDSEYKGNGRSHKVKGTVKK